MRKKHSKGSAGEVYIISIFSVYEKSAEIQHDSSALANEEAQLHLFFDPDDHPENTLKAFEEFIQQFELHDDAMYPDPPKVSLEAALNNGKSWKQHQKIHHQNQT